MNKKTINFTADKVTHQGVEVSAEGVPAEDIVKSINEDDAASILIMTCCLVLSAKTW